MCVLRHNTMSLLANVVVVVVVNLASCVVSKRKAKISDSS